MRLPLYQVDAFTDEVFRGNPAAVVPLERWLADELLQAIALENNLSETAFFVPAGGDQADFELRWFTPAVEVPLCGHATLASAHVLFHHLGFAGGSLRFESKSGSLRVERGEDSEWGEVLVLDFPASSVTPIEITGEIAEAVALALGDRPEELYRIPRGLENGLLAVFPTEARVRALDPDFRALASLAAGVVVVTAPGVDADMASRVFAPGAGIDEDPVTGAAHCSLTPYWSQRLGRQQLRARQVSARGGELRCESAGDRVRLAGRAVTYLEGSIEVPA